MRKLVSAFVLLLCIPAALLSAEAIRFSGGSTRMQMQEGYQSISLSGGAEITSGTLTLTADSIELSGEEFRYVSCTGAVTLNDDERGVTLLGNNLFYDREEELVVVDGYLELEDLTNEVQATAFFLEFSLDEGSVLLQVQVRLYKHTDSGVMACKADSLQLEREKRTLELGGNATIDWAGDRYEAQRITVDLDTEQISMDGTIKGVING
ncbi:LptA/OstA family protein [Sphaerochaeta sp.]|uniref:LptA/OstA family protein n=1 Tax=Sphaerochaeta sp. TaxID=1972642 RepID=UPI003D0C4FD0